MTVMSCWTRPLDAKRAATRPWFHRHAACSQDQNTLCFARSLRRPGGEHSRGAKKLGECNALVSLGMTDVGGITGKIVRALAAGEPSWALDVVLNSRAQSRAEVVALVASSCNV